MNSECQNNQKNAIKLLKEGRLIYCDTSEPSKIEASFKDKNTDKPIKTLINASDLSLISCSCGKENCEHLSALRIHAEKYLCSDRKTQKTSSKPDYGSLLSREREKLFSELRKDNKESFLKILIDGSTPHLPSRWSKLKLSVDIINGNRTYKGSLGNLRQIQTKNIIGAISTEKMLSLQEKQIIRFLSYNADYEDSFLILNSEKASDFFHCLPGYQNVFSSEGSLSFYSEPTELAVSVYQFEKRVKLLPVLKTKFANFQLVNSCFILGQNGAWIGISGHYFWLPGTKDVKWIRDFVRSKHEFINPSDFENEINKLKSSGISIIKKEDISKLSRAISPTPLLTAEVNENNRLYLRLLFDYEDLAFKADFKNVGFAGKKIIERDINAELRYIQKILLAGFKENSLEMGTYYTDEAELKCLFFSRLINQWQNEMKVFTRNTFDKIQNTTCSNITIYTAFLSSTQTDFILNFSFLANGEKIEPDTLIKAVDGNRDFIEIKNGVFAEITPQIKEFIKSFRDVLLKSENDKILLSKAQSQLWEESSANIEQIRIKEISDFVAKINNHQQQIEIPHSFNGTMRDYQIEGYKWIISRKLNGLNALLADEMGLGKTIQAICAILHLKEIKKGQHREFQGLVLCPSSLTENWKMEFAKFAKDLNVILLHGSDREKFREKANLADIIISSYSTFKKDIQWYAEKTFDIVVLDEAQHIKNPETGNARSCKKIKADFKLVLSGTPVENAPIELWSIIDFLHQGILGSHNYFKKQFQSGDRRENLSKLSLRISPIILRRRKQDVLSQLPPKTEQLLYSDMSEEQFNAYQKIFTDFRENFAKIILQNEGQSHKLEILTMLLRLRQFCCHPSLLPEEFNIKNIPSAKTELLKELLLEAEDSGQKTLVFSQFPPILKIIASWLDHRKQKYEYLDGTTTKRMEHVQRFNSEKDYTVFLLSIRAGGFGLNLTSAERVIIYDPWWNPAVEKQAADRSHRIGQIKPVTVQKLIVKNSIEEKILSLQERKKTLFNELVESAPSTFRNISIEDIKELFS